MSDLSTLGTTGALFSSASFLLYYCTAKINNRGHEIVIGVIAGVPVSTRYRRFLLWTTWLPQWAAAVMISMIFTAMFVAVARQAGGADVKTIAYLCAGATGSGAFFFFVFGIPYASLLASAVRQAEAH